MRAGRAWLFLAVWIALTSALLTFPFRRAPNVVQQGYDKVIHTSLFTVMGVAAQAAGPWVTLLLTAPVAVGLEYVQKGIPSRTFSFVDMLANLTGIVLGVSAFELSSRLRR
jgi:VanZ family protein